MEREVAALFKTVRVPLSGSNSGHNTSSDSLHDKLYIECKYRAKMAVRNLFDDTEAKANKEGKTPVVALRVKGRQGVLLVARPEHLEEIAKELKTSSSSQCLIS